MIAPVHRHGALKIPWGLAGEEGDHGIHTAIPGQDRPERRVARQVILFNQSDETCNSTLVRIRAACIAVPAHDPPLPAALAPHTIESLHAMHGGRRPWIYWVVLAGVVAGLASLPLVEFDVSFSAPGIVRPATERVELRAPFGGSIARLLVRDNQQVDIGQPLIVLGTPDLDERLSYNAAQRREKLAVLELLESLSVFRGSSLPTLSIGFETGLAESPAPIRTLWQEVVQFEAQLESNRMTEAKAGTELARATELAKKASPRNGSLMMLVMHFSVCRRKAV